MRKRILSVGVACLSLVLSSWAIGQDAAKAKRTEDAQKRITGKWNIVSGANQGKELNADQVQDTLVVIRNKTIVVLDPDERELYKANFEVDTSSTPLKINMVTDMPNVPKSQAWGIFEFTDAGWRLCYALPGSDRPEKFVSPKGSHIMLFNLTPAEKEKPDFAATTPEE